MTIKSVFGIQFTRSGWKQFCRVNRSFGSRYIRAFVLKHELAIYLAAHERVGIHMDTDCHEIRYDAGIYLLLRKEGGIWYITDVILSDAPDTFLPVYSVRSILRGIMTVIALVFTGWHYQSGKNNRKAVIV